MEETRVRVAVFGAVRGAVRERVRVVGLRARVPPSGSRSEHPSLSPCAGRVPIEHSSE